MTTAYAFKANVLCPVPAQTVGEELDRIHVAHNGRLTQEDVVDAAKDFKNPLHPVFEWDDAKAAYMHRLEQASYLIRSVVVVREDQEDAVPVRAFVNVQRDTDQSYTTMAHAMSDDELRAQVLGRALRELESWRDRYSELVELAKLFAQVDKTIERLTPKQ